MTAFDLRWSFRCHDLQAIPDIQTHPRTIEEAMKYKPSNPFIRISRPRLLAGLAVVGLGTTQAETTGTWNYNGTVTASNSWNTAASWTGLTDGLVPNAVGATPNLTFNITAARTITLDGDKTMGALTLGDPTSSFFAHTVSPGSPTTSRLIFDQTGVANATLTVQPSANTAANVISAGILLNDHLVIDGQPTTASAVALNFSGVIDDAEGSFSVTKDGPSIIALSGNNTYDGGTVINGGRVNAPSATSFGTGPVTVASGAQAFLNGSGTRTNAFTIEGIGFTETAGNLGAIRLQGATISGPIGLSFDARITAHGNTGTLAGDISEVAGPAALELSNYNTGTDSTITVSGNNSYSLGTTVKGAIVVANQNNAFGTGTVTLQSNGTAARTTRVQLGTDVVLPVANGFILDSNAVTGTAAISSYAGDNTTVSTAVVSGPVEIWRSVGGGGHFASNKGSASVLRITGPVTSPNGVPVVVRQGIVELGGGGDYGLIEITDGTLKLAADNGIATNAALTVGTSGTGGDTGTFDLNGYNQALAGLLNGPRPASVRNDGAGPATLTLNPPANSTYGGTFDDGASALNLVKSGTGRLTLSGASTNFTGAITVTEGELNLTGTLGTTGANASIGAATLSGEGTFGGDLVLAGTTLNVDGTTPLGVSAAGTVNATGGVAVNLVSLPEIPGPITVVTYGTALTGSPGNFSLIDGAAYRSPVFSVAGNSVVLTLGTPVDLTWTGTGGSDWNVGGTSNWNNPSLAPSSFFYADNVTFGNTGGGTISIPANVNPGNLTINSNDNWLFQGAGTVAASSVVKDGSGTATFETPVNFGNLTLTSGLLRVSPPTGITADIPGIITGAGILAKGGEGVLAVSGANPDFTGQMVISKGELVAAGNTAFGTAKVVFGDETTLATDVCTLTLNSGIALATSQIEIGDTCADARISGVGSITGTTITHKSTGRLTIGHPTAYTTATNYVTGSSSVSVEKGTLAFSSRTALATGTAVTLGNANSGSDDTVLEIPNASVADQEVLNAAFTLGTLAEGSTSKAIFRYVAAGTVGGAPRVNGTVDLNGRDLILENTSLIDNPANSGLYNFAPLISGTGNVRIRCGTNPDGSYNGTPRARLMNTANSWTGDLYLETGMLQVGNGSITTAFNAIPNGSVVHMSPGTRMGFGSSGDTFSGLTGGGATEAIPFPAVVDDNTSGGGTITITLSGGGDYVYDGNFNASGSRTINIVKSGTGTQTFTGTRAGLGAVTVSGGTLVLNGSRTGDAAAATTTTTTVSGTGTLAVGKDDALGIGTVNLNSATGTIRSADENNRTLANPITYSTNFTLGSPTTGNLLFTGTVNVGSGSKVFDVQNAVTEFSGVISGGGTLTRTKSGPGTLVFSGPNTYPGTTVVNAGTLLVNNPSGSGTGTTNVEVNSGGTFGGTGGITGAVTLKGGTLSPGASIESLGVGALTSEAGSTMIVEFDSSSNATDVVNVTGALSLGAGLCSLQLVDTAAIPQEIATGTKLTIVTYGSSTGGTFATLAEEGTVTVGATTFKIRYADGNAVTLEAVGGDPYGGWLAGYPALTGADRSPEVDFDGDGLDNGIEFVIGSDPTSFTASTTPGYPQAAVGGGNVVFTFTRSTASKAYPVAVQTSIDLLTWPPANAYLIPTTDGTSGAVTVAGESVTVTIPMAPDAKKFTRLHADIPFIP
jgi:autotransporter-associated beta strand protein